MKKTALIISIISIFALSACNDDDEEGRIYSSRDPDECERIKFTCVPGSSPFSDDTGCGCEINKNINSDRGLRDKDRNNTIIPDTDDDFDKDINTRGRDDEDENRLNNDPLERDLDSIQDKRLEKD